MSDTEPTNGTAEPTEPHETRDLPARGIVYALGALLAGIAVSLAIVAGVRWWLAPDRPPPVGIVGEDLPFTGPQLLTEPAEQRIALERQARQRLDGYAWVDRGEGVARIPVERAMALMAERGWRPGPSTYDPDSRSRGPRPIAGGTENASDGRSQAGAPGGPPPAMPSSANGADR